MQMSQQSLLSFIPGIQIFENFLLYWYFVMLIFQDIKLANMVNGKFPSVPEISVHGPVKNIFDQKFSYSNLVDPQEVSLSSLIFQPFKIQNFQKDFL